MIESYYRPKSIDEALSFKKQYGEMSCWIANGARFNSAYIEADYKIGISLECLGLDTIESDGRQYHIGATVTLQQLVDSDEIPKSLSEAANLIFNRNIRNQATIGGEIASKIAQCQIVPALIAMNATLLLAGGKSITVEQFISENRNDLIIKIVVSKDIKVCFSQKISATCSSLPIVLASVSSNEKGEFSIVLSGVSSTPVRLRDVEKFVTRGSNSSSINLAVEKAIFPQTDLLGSSEYKQHISGILVSRLVQKCRDYMKGGEK